MPDLVLWDRGQRPGRRRAGAGRQVSGGRHCGCEVVEVGCGGCWSSGPVRTGCYSWRSSGCVWLGAGGGSWRVMQQKLVFKYS